jgi:hypothetical protein
MAYKFRLICALALSLGSLPAQETPKEQGKSTSTPPGQGPQKNRPPDFRRWGIGGIFSYTPLNLMRGGAATVTTSQQYTDTLGSKSESRPLGGGVAGYFYLTRTLSLNLDFIYRRTGYNATTSLNDPLTTMTYDRTRANYFDFPLLARYHVSKYHLLHSPVFIEAGGTMRYVDQITSSTTVNTTVNSALVSTCCSEVPDRPDHRIVYGPTVGLGLRLQPDEFGVRITPEIRYTRWLESTFSSGPTKSNHDQAEVLISITF